MPADSVRLLGMAKKSFTDYDRWRAVRQVIDLGMPVDEVAKQVGCAQTTLRNWITQETNKLVQAAFEDNYFGDYRLDYIPSQEEVADFYQTFPAEYHDLKNAEYFGDPDMGIDPFEITGRQAPPPIPKKEMPQETFYRQRHIKPFEKHQGSAPEGYSPYFPTAPINHRDPSLGPHRAVPMQDVAVIRQWALEYFEDYPYSVDLCVAPYSVTIVVETPPFEPEKARSVKSFFPWARLEWDWIGNGWVLFWFDRDSNPHPDTLAPVGSLRDVLEYLEMPASSIYMF